VFGNVTVIDHHEVAESLLTSYLVDEESKIAERFDSIWSRDAVARSRKIRNLLLNLGASAADANAGTISEAWLGDVAALSVKEAKARFMPDLAIV
jgi:hypothetical protein